MESTTIKHFEGKRVKLIYRSDFVLIGTILKVYQDSILFKTDQAESIISLYDIKHVVGGY